MNQRIEVEGTFSSLSFHHCKPRPCTINRIQCWAMQEKWPIWHHSFAPETSTLSCLLLNSPMSSMLHPAARETLAFRVQPSNGIPLPRASLICRALPLCSCTSFLWSLYILVCFCRGCFPSGSPHLSSHLEPSITVSHSAMPSYNCNPCASFPVSSSPSVHLI